MFLSFTIQVDQYIHRILVEEDAHHLGGSTSELYHASSEAGKFFYRRGDYAESQISNLDSYLLKKVPSQLAELGFIVNQLNAR